jgi:hypothetical protein
MYNFPFQSAAWSFVSSFEIPAKRGKKEKKKENIYVKIIPRKSLSPRPFAFTSSSSNVPTAISLSLSLCEISVFTRF